MQYGREDTLEERYAIKLCFKLGKNDATETYGMLQTDLGASCMNRAWVFEWHKRFKQGKESVRDDESCGRAKEVNTPQLIGQIKNFMDKVRCVSIEAIIMQIISTNNSYLELKKFSSFILTPSLPWHYFITDHEIPKLFYSYTKLGFQTVCNIFKKS